MSWRGVFTGALMLIALEAVVRTNQSADRVGGLLEDLGGLVRRAMSPAVPAIPLIVEPEKRFYDLDSNGPLLPGG